MRLTQLGQASYLPHPEAAGASSVSGGRQGAWSISSVQNLHAVRLDRPFSHVSVCREIAYDHPRGIWEVAPRHLLVR